MSDQSAKLVHEFTYHAAVSSPHEVGVGPFGHRQYYEMTEGVLKGARLNGKLLGSGSDWMLVGPDGFMRMDVRIQIETDDQAVICAHYFGPGRGQSEAGPGHRCIHIHRVLRSANPLPLAAGDRRPAIRLGQSGGVRRRGPPASRQPRRARLRAPGLSPGLTELGRRSRQGVKPACSRRRAWMLRPVAPSLAGRRRAQAPHDQIEPLVERARGVRLRIQPRNGTPSSGRPSGCRRR